MQRDRQDRAQPCPARQSQQKRIRERIADQRLEGRAGNAQRTADEKGEQRARGAQIPHDIGAQQLVERHGGGPEHHARNEGQNSDDQQQRPFHRDAVPPNRTRSARTASPDRGPGRPNNDPGSSRKWPSRTARTARHSCLLANAGIAPESDSTAIHWGSRAAIVSSETCAEGAAMSLKTLRAPASAAS